MLHRMELVERIGSGIGRIRELCDEHGVPKPVMETSADWVTVCFPRSVEDGYGGGEASGAGFGDGSGEGAGFGSGAGLADGSGKGAGWAGGAGVDVGVSRVGMGSPLWPGPESKPESLARRALQVLSGGPLSKSAIAARLGHRSVSGGLNRVVRRLLAEGRIARTVPDRPGSRLQRYEITAAGRREIAASNPVRSKGSEDEPE